MASVKGRRKQRKATHSIIDNSLHFGGRKKRQPYTSQQRKLLHEMYFKDKHPSPEAKKELSRVANIDLKRIDEWLWNARRRIPHPSDTGCTGGSVLISGDNTVPTTSSSSPECQNAAPLSKKLPATGARKPASMTNNLSKLPKPSSSFGTIKASSEKPLFQTIVAGTSARNKAHGANFITESDEAKQPHLTLLSSNVVGSDLSRILVMKKSVLDESAPSEFHGKVSDNSACKGLITNESNAGFLNSMECREIAFSLKQDSSKDKINYAEDSLTGGSVCQFPTDVTNIALQSPYTNLYTETSPGSSYYDPLVINPPPEPPQDLFDISPPHPPTSPESISITPAPTPPLCLAPIVSTSVGCLNLKISASAVREHSPSLALPSSSLISQCLKLASTKKKNTSSSAIHTLEPSSTELTPNTSSSSSSSSFPPSPAMMNLLVPQNQLAMENIAWNSDLEIGSEKNKNI